MRVYTDGAAGRSAATVDAHAYTSGRELVFAHGRYDPATPAGRHLLARELAHVVQQRRSPSPAPIQRFTAYSSAEQTSGRSRGWRHPTTTDMRVSDDGQMAVDDKGWNPGTNKRAWTTPALISARTASSTAPGLARSAARPSPAATRSPGRRPRAGRGLDAYRDGAVPAERRDVQPDLGLRRTPVGRSSAAGLSAAKRRRRVRRDARPGSKGTGVRSASASSAPRRRRRSEPLASPATRPSSAPSSASSA